MDRIVRIIAWAACAAAGLGAASARGQEAVICLAACDAPAEIDFTLRGGERDSLSIGRFTPRSAVEGDTGGFEAGISGYGLELHGGVASEELGDAPLDSLNFGAAYALGPVTVGGEVTLGLSDGDRDEAGLGVDWRPVEGLTLGGALSLAGESAGAAAPERDLSAGVRVRLDF
jgi:hypothetical protein